VDQLFEGQKTHRSTIIKVSVQRLFHPDAASEQKQVIHCSALDHAALCSTAIAVIQALFPSLEGSKGMFNLYFVIPAVSVRLSMGEGRVLAQLSAAHTIVFHLRDPIGFPLLNAFWPPRGPCRSYPPAACCIPPSLSGHVHATIGLGEEQQQQQSVLDLPLNIAVQRYKRETDQERADNRAWRRLHRGETAMK